LWKVDAQGVMAIDSTQVDAFLIGTVLFFSALFGAWTAIAVAQIATGRALFLFLPRRVNWSDREARLLGLGWLGSGGSGLIYFLVGGLSLAAHQTPPFWMQAIWFLIFFGSLVFQLLLVQRHNKGWPFNRAGKEHRGL
jgi:hypothetical protein